MSNSNPFDSRERLRRKSGEYLSMPEHQRVYTITRSRIHVQNCTQAGDVNYVRDSLKSRAIVDSVINSPNANAASPAPKAADNKSSEANPHNVDLLSQAYEKLARLQGDDSVK